MNLNKGLKPVALLCSSALHLLANAQDIEAEIEVSLPVVEVQAESLQQRVYTREQMDVTPQSNRDLAGLISDHPAVRPISNQEGAANKGSLAPDSFSIHGESPYQNQFQIDGINATNVIKPQEVTGSSAQINSITGFSQAYNLDTDLLGEVQVYDNRVPIEFSGFTGGVIDAKIKNPIGSGRWEIKRSYNTSSLTKQEVPESVRKKWEEGTAGFSSNWKKHFSSITGDIALNDSTNALLSFSRRQSTITRMQSMHDPLALEWSQATLTTQETQQDDMVDNLLAKVQTRIADAKVNLVLKYADRTEDLVTNNTVAHGLSWTNHQKSYGVSGEYLRPLAYGLLSVQAGFDSMDMLREDDKYGLITERDLPGGSYNYGGMGTEALEQTQYTLKTRHDWTPWQVGQATQKFYAGVDLQNTQAEFVRPKDVVHETYRRNQAGGARYLDVLHHYAAGSISTKHNSAGMYFAYALHWQRWSLNTAARWDRNDFLNRTNFSPRIGLDWDMYGDASSKLGLGWSRYHGMDMLGYALEEKKANLLTYVIRAGNNGQVVNEAASVTPHHYNDLKTPYSDELAFSYVQRLNPIWMAKAEYVHRASRDAITSRTVSGVVTYANGGRSRNETFTLGVHSTQPIRWAGAAWVGGMDFSWMKTERNHQSTAGWGAYAGDDDDIIKVDGVEMKRKDKPVSEFALPRRMTMSWSANWANARVKWGNRVNWNASRTGLALAVVGAGSAKETYNTEKLPSYWTWDSTVQWSPNVMKGMTLSVEVLNVLNQIRPISVVSSSAGATRMQTGREIWLNASYEF